HWFTVNSTVLALTLPVLDSDVVDAGPFHFPRAERLGAVRLRAVVSNRFLNFMERSFNNDAFYQKFTNGYFPGVLAFNTAFDLRMTWAAGVFKNVSNPYDYMTGGGGWAETGRVTGL